MGRRNIPGETTTDIMTRDQAVNFMTTIAGEHIVANPFADDGTDVDLDGLVRTGVEHFGLEREAAPLAMWDWAADAAACYYRSLDDKSRPIPAQLRPTRENCPKEDE